MSEKIVKLADYCDVEQLLSILENWSQGTGLSAIVVDKYGIPLTKSYGMSKFCSMIQSTEEGKSRCKNNWKDKKYGLHECHAGFYDFAIPLVLPDKTEIGRVLAGQVYSEDINADEIIKKVSGIGLDESEVKSTLENIERKKRTEMEGSYKLLKQMIMFFLEKSYSEYQENERRKLGVLLLTAGLKTVYRISMYFNVTQNRYKLIDVSEGVENFLPSEGTIDEIVGIGVKTIPDKKQADEYYRLFNRDSLVEAYKNGAREITLRYEQKIYTGDRHWMEGRLVFVETGDDDIYAVCLSRVIDEEIQNNLKLNEALEQSRKHQKLLQNALDNYKQADYDRRRDFLTGLRNRQDMFDLFSDALSGKRSEIKSMFMMDIDNFKKLNDKYGHVYGDECLIKIGEALNKYGNENNIYFYRYGGEELLGISFNDKQNDRQIAEDLVKLIYDLKLERKDSEIGYVTVSLGYTSDNSRYEKMIDKADNAMYYAKNNGKNHAICFEDIRNIR